MNNSSGVEKRTGTCQTENPDSAGCIAWHACTSATHTHTRTNNWTLLCVLLTDSISANLIAALMQSCYYCGYCSGVTMLM